MFVALLYCAISFMRAGVANKALYVKLTCFVDVIGGFLSSCIL